MGAFQLGWVQLLYPESMPSLWNKKQSSSNKNKICTKKKKKKLVPSHSCLCINQTPAKQTGGYTGILVMSRCIKQTSYGTPTGISFFTVLDGRKVQVGVRVPYCSAERGLQPPAFPQKLIWTKIIGKFRSSGEGTLSSDIKTVWERNKNSRYDFMAGFMLFQMTASHSGHLTRWILISPRQPFRSQEMWVGQRLFESLFFLSLPFVFAGHWTRGFPNWLRKM